jgi:hypothetical protein
MKHNMDKKWDWCKGGSISSGKLGKSGKEFMFM